MRNLENGELLVVRLHGGRTHTGSVNVNAEMSGALTLTAYDMGFLFRADAISNITQTM